MGSGVSFLLNFYAKEFSLKHIKGRIGYGFAIVKGKVLNKKEMEALDKEKEQILQERNEQDGVLEEIEIKEEQEEQ